MKIGIHELRILSDLADKGVVLAIDQGDDMHRILISDLSESTKGNWLS